MLEKFFKKPTPAWPLSIGITTFGRRFDRYFVPLLESLRRSDGECEIVVAVNGEHETGFDEDYRRRLLAFLGGVPAVYPVVFPRFRSLAKLWNTLLLHATADHVLILNDDVRLARADVIAQLRKALPRMEGRSFVINGSWSHFVAAREEIDRLGYFDERLLGIGEEDGDMAWRYEKAFGRPVARCRIKGLVNCAGETRDEPGPANVRARSAGKYSRFNRRFMFDRKYRPDPAGLRSMFDGPVSLQDPGPAQYPNERFYRRHKKEL